METKKLNFTQEHVPCSVALHNNLHGSSQTKFISNADPQALVDSFVEYLEDLVHQNEANQAQKV